MGSVARLAAVGSAIALCACAVIAGLDDPSVVDESTSGSSSSGSERDTGNGSSSGGGSSSGSATSDSSSDGASSSGNPGDAQPDAPTCSLFKIGDTCQAHSQCCSNKCNENRQCTSGCSGTGTFCDPFSDDDCCVGMWCNTQCAACIGPNQPAAKHPVTQLTQPLSCCSRSLKPLSTDCQ